MGGTPAYSFLDWTGDSGFRFGRGSSRLFVICVVSTPDYEHIRALLERLRIDLGLNTKYHFHYAHIPNTIKARYSEFLPSLDFSATGLVVDKQRLPRSYHQRESTFICRFLSEVMASGTPSAFLAKRLLVDSPQKDTELIRQLRVAISETLRARGLLPIPKVRGEPAVRWDGLQLADMLAGMIADGYLAEETILPRLGDRLEVFEHIPQ